MKSKTQSGLLFLIVGSIISLIYGLIISTYSFFIEDYQVLVIVSAFLILFFIGAILIVIGAVLFLIGRKEFGEKHQKNVISALVIFIIIIFVIPIITSFMVFFIVSSYSFTSDTYFSPYISFIIIISTVSVILSSLMYYFALIELEDDKGRYFLYGGIISAICVSIITSVFISGILDEIFGSFSFASRNPSFTGFSSIGGIGIFGIIPGILFIIALYIPYYRIKVGELIPQVLTAYVPAYGSNAPGRLCPNCGRGIPMDALLCPYCGKRF